MPDWLAPTVRSGNSVTISTTDWDDEGNYVPGPVISVDLGSDRQLVRFMAARNKAVFGTSRWTAASYRIKCSIWIRKPACLMSGTVIQGVIAYPLEITNPETGETYLIERRGYHRGRWQDRWNRWSQWDQSNSDNKDED
jgi:hypothetical protein